ncbi:MAG: hypothetical protein HYV07_01445 [Deltaproteobacteria bacterium]|nr:hypothetical protein [Deltaproteobacteria bacterium]
MTYINSLGSRFVDPVNGHHQYQYVYDPAGNRISAWQDGSRESYAYDAEDRMSAVGGIAVDFDSNGNQLLRGAGRADRFFWDAENRLIRTEMPGGAASYAYDVDGVRISRTTTAAATVFANDVGRAVTQAIEQRSQGAVTSYVFARGQRLESAANGSRYYSSTDGPTNVRIRTTGDGASFEQCSYNALGVRQPDFGVTHGFAGEPSDPLTSTIHLRAREYDPSSGRFLGRDPRPSLLRNIPSNPYSFSRSDPVNLRDPLGLFTMIEVFIALTIHTDLSVLAQPYGALTPEEMVTVAVALNATARFRWSTIPLVNRMREPEHARSLVQNWFRTNSDGLDEARDAVQEMWTSVWQNMAGWRIRGATRADNPILDASALPEPLCRKGVARNPKMTSKEIVLCPGYVGIGLSRGHPTRDGVLVHEMIHELGPAHGNLSLEYDHRERTNQVLAQTAEADAPENSLNNPYSFQYQFEEELLNAF